MAIPHGVKRVVMDAYSSFNVIGLADGLGNINLTCPSCFPLSLWYREIPWPSLQGDAGMELLFKSTFRVATLPPAEPTWPHSS